MEHIINVSELEAPEPLEKIVDALADMPSGDWLKVVHRLNPVPMYGIVKDMGYLCDMQQISSHRFEILIWPESEPKPPTVQEQAS